MLTISGLTYRVGGRHGRVLLNEANAQIPDGSKIGLVGRNGAGKSTLLDLIRGRLLPDTGDVFLPRGWRIGFLAQDAPGAFSPGSVSMPRCKRGPYRSCRAAGACASRSPLCCFPSLTCCCSTSRP